LILPIGRSVPPFVDDREEVVLPDEVDRAVAEGLVREVRPIRCAGEGDIGAVHVGIVRPVLIGRNPGGPGGGDEA